MQLQIFVVAGGARIFLKEKVSRVLLLGAGIASAGFSFFAMPGVSSHTLDLLGLLYSLCTVLCFASMLVWTRAVIKNLDPIALNAGRLWLGSLSILIWPGVLQGLFEMSGKAWVLCFGAAFSGPFVARLAIMYALRYITAAQTKLWSMLSPVIAFLLVFLVYGIVPGGREILGALLIAFGMLLPTLVHRKKLA